jgi:hypothetical protein
MSQPDPKGKAKSIYLRDHLLRDESDQTGPSAFEAFTLAQWNGSIAARAPGWFLVKQLPPCAVLPFATSRLRTSCRAGGAPQDPIPLRSDHSDSEARDGPPRGGVRPSICSALHHHAPYMESQWRGTRPNHAAWSRPLSNVAAGLQPPMRWRLALQCPEPVSRRAPIVGLCHDDELASKEATWRSNSSQRIRSCLAGTSCAGSERPRRKCLDAELLLALQLDEAHGGSGRRSAIASASQSSAGPRALCRQRRAHVMAPQHASQRCTAFVQSDDAAACSCPDRCQGSPCSRPFLSSLNDYTGFGGRCGGRAIKAGTSVRLWVGGRLNQAEGICPDSRRPTLCSTYFCSRLIVGKSTATDCPAGHSRMNRWGGRRGNAGRSLQDSDLQRLPS